MLVARTSSLLIAFMDEVMQVSTRWNSVDVDVYGFYTGREFGYAKNIVKC